MRRSRTHAMAEGSSCGQARTLAAVHLRRPPLVWAGYAAFAWGLVFGGISFYWALGGILGSDTVGSSVEQMATANGHAALWITGFMKVLGAVLALALVQPWGWRLPRPLLLVLGWGAAAVLTLYGGVNVAGEALTASGLIRPGTVDWKSLLWHLYVWDMSFLVWGVLFGLAAWYHTWATSRSW